MVFFSLTMVPLEKLTRAKVEGMLQKWYADNASMAVKLHMIAATACIIIEKGPEWGYYMKLEKSLLIFKDSVTETTLEVLGKFSFPRSD